MTESRFKQLISKVESWFMNPTTAGLDTEWGEHWSDGLLLNDDEASTLHELLFYMERELTKDKD